ncbi:MAG TPA: FmdB family zinc ribbon protein [Candidatus Deferrimicrobium sp.]
MPLYEYQCAKCAMKSEFIQNFSDPHETTCPRCGGVLKKLLSSPAVQFKGSGFYATDYGKSGRTDRESASKAKDAKEGGETKSEGGGESKGVSKGESAGESTADSSKGKKDGGPGAAPAAPSGSSPPAPSKKKNGDAK